MPIATRHVVVLATFLTGNGNSGLPWQYASAFLPSSSKGLFPFRQDPMADVPLPLTRSTFRPLKGIARKPYTDHDENQMHDFKERTILIDRLSEHELIGAVNDREKEMQQQKANKQSNCITSFIGLVPLTMLSATFARVDFADAKGIVSSGDFDPDKFRPVCGASDGFYRFLQGVTEAVVGDENFVEYGPLIAQGLLRVRLELCVVESYFNEAVGPFIQQNGLSWVLPLHETVETFLAGTIFALATTFILVGSSKIVAVIVTYGDILVGGPCRLFGGFAFDRALGKPVTLDIGIGPWKKRFIGPPMEKDDNASGAADGKGIDLDNIEPVKIPILLASGTVKAAGEVSKILREITEGFDLFVGRYLTIIATGYIGLKFVHFKVFPDFPPF